MPGGGSMQGANNSLKNNRALRRHVSRYKDANVVGMGAKGDAQPEEIKAYEKLSPLARQQAKRQRDARLARQRTWNRAFWLLITVITIGLICWSLYNWAQ